MGERREVEGDGRGKKWQKERVWKWEGGGRVRGGERGRERGLAVLGVNERSARLTNIKMCTGDAG